MEADSVASIFLDVISIILQHHAHETAVEFPIFVDYIFRERATKSILLSSVIVLSDCGYVKAIHTFAQRYKLTAAYYTALNDTYFYIYTGGSLPVLGG